MVTSALVLLGLTCFFAAATAQAPLPPQDVPSLVAAAATAAGAAQRAAGAALEAALNLQRNSEQAPVPPVAVAAGSPAPVSTPAPELPSAGVPPTSSTRGTTFAVPGYEQPLAGSGAAGEPSLAGLKAPAAEIGAVLVEEGGLPARAILQGLPERLSASLQGEQPLVQGSGGG